MSYFIDGEFCLLAHRGLSQHRRDVDENTIPAFEQALMHGATHLESDIQATKDGIAVLFHDDDLSRVAGLDKPVSELHLEQLQNIRLNSGGTIPTLKETLQQFPEARFNLDLKTPNAIEPTAETMIDLDAHERVLLSSFSASTRQAILEKTNRKTATSADARTFLSLYGVHHLGYSIANSIKRDFHALQIPLKRGILKFDSPRFVQMVKKMGLQLHYWTINDPQQMLELSRFATGIVTDRVDLAPNSLRA